MSRRIRGSLKWQWRIPAASCFAPLHGVANALGDDVSSVGLLAEKCQTDANALYRLLHALASIGVTEETTHDHFRLTPFGKPLRRDVSQSVWSAVISWAELLADDWSLLTDCVQTVSRPPRTVQPSSRAFDRPCVEKWDGDIYRESSHIQLTSHVFPPSGEKDCSIRDDLGEMLSQT